MSSNVVLGNNDRTPRDAAVQITPRHLQLRAQTRPHNHRRDHKKGTHEEHNRGRIKSKGEHSNASGESSDRTEDKSDKHANAADMARSDNVGTHGNN